MDLTTITVDQFKAYFVRDFPYLSNLNYDDTVTYNIGTEVYYTDNGLFYTCTANNTFAKPPDANPANWGPYSDNVNNYVLDSDIESAFARAQIVFNQSLLSDDASITVAYLICSAHFLCVALRTSQTGLNGGGGFPIQSKTVGSMSSSYMIPDRYRLSPILSTYTSTSYGMEYLSLVLPDLVGNYQAVIGGAQP